MYTHKYDYAAYICKFSNTYSVYIHSYESNFYYFLEVFHIFWKVFAEIPVDIF